MSNKPVLWNGKLVLKWFRIKQYCCWFKTVRLTVLIYMELEIDSTHLCEGISG